MKILKNKNLLYVVIVCIILLIVGIVLLVKKSISVGYVTIDINNDSIVLGYNSKHEIKKVTGTNVDVKNLDIIKGIDKVLAEYNAGTTILIGLENDDTTKKIEKYFIEKYKGIDRHILEFITLDKNKTGKEKLASELGLDSSLTIVELIDKAREKGIDLDKYIKELDDLEGYHSRD